MIYTQYGHYSDIKKNEILSFVEYPEECAKGQEGTEKQVSHAPLQMWKLKKKIDWNAGY